MTYSRKFECSLFFRDSWRATPEEIDMLVERMIDSITSEGITGLSFHGDIGAGTLSVRFDAPTTSEEDSLTCVGIVVRALNAGCVEAPGWPSNGAIDHAIASVSVRECIFAA